MTRSTFFATPVIDFSLGYIILRYVVMLLITSLPLGDLFSYPCAS